MEPTATFTAFVGHHLLVTGDQPTMLRRTKAHLDANPSDPVLIFEDATGRQVDFDFRGTADDVIARASPPKPRPGPGRPKLGVVSREVTLLPRHWEWLEQQPQGASAALRRLVEDARRRDPAPAHARRARDAAAKFMWAMAGNLPHFEEATRALYADDPARLEDLMRDWPPDVRAYVLRLARGADSRQSNLVAVPVHTHGASTVTP